MNWYTQYNDEPVYRNSMWPLNNNYYHMKPSMTITSHSKIIIEYVGFHLPAGKTGLTLEKQTINR